MADGFNQLSHDALNTASGSSELNRMFQRIFDILPGGAIRYYDDLRVEPNVRGTGSNNPALVQWFTNGAASVGCFLYEFTNVAAANEKEMFFTAQMPHSWDGTIISPHVHWVPKASENNASVRWGLEYTWAEIGGTFGNSTIVYTSSKFPDDTNLVQYKHYVSDFTDITADSNQDGLSAILICRLFRNSSHADDTFTGISGLLYVDFHFPIDSFGSTMEYSKTA